MKNFIFLIVMLLSVNIIYSQQDTIKGTLQTCNSPCLTNPCLPGIVYSIKSKDSTYMITKSGKVVFTDNDFLYNNIKITIGDSLKIYGIKSFKTDINGNHYTTLEINTLILNLINDLKSENKLSLYPNPFKESIHVEFDNSNNVDYMSIYDNQGKELYRNSNISKLSVLNLNTDSFAQGIYFFVCKNNNGTIIVNKIIKN